MLDRIHNYVNDDEFRFTVYENKVHILNFKRIISLEDNYISLQSRHKKITIYGMNLVLNKLMDQEMLVTGIISKIEVGNE